MIKSLYIRNYVLIDESELTFDKGLTCITGEAGAGKSIILGAIGLVLGDRADTRLCFDKDEKSIIEAAFEFDDDKLKSFFEENNIDYETNSTVRREITPQGKSRCFINDTPVNLQVLRTFGMKILDLHTQYQKFSLSDNNSQLEYLDNYIKDVVSVEDYQSCYNAYMAVSHELDASKALMEKQTKEKDYVNFLYKELEDAKLIAGELESLEKELDRLNNAELIKDRLTASIYALSDNEEMNVLALCHDIKSNLSSVASYLENGEELVQRFDSTYIELKDIYGELSSEFDKIEFNPQRQQQCNERIDFLYTLMRKHNVNSIDELIDVKTRLSNSLFDLDKLYEKIQSLTAEKASLLKELSLKSDILSKQRRSSAVELSRQISNELEELGIQHNRFVISITDLSDFTSTGKDYVEFLFSGNVGVEPAPVFHTASGGELSRIMLALKTVIASRNFIDTMIFDEIDSGISGVTASAVASKMKLLSEKIQVIAITHLPQIASKADAQYEVYKESTEQRTYTKVKLLSFDERISTIASMISGSIVNEDALNNARFLLNN